MRLFTAIDLSDQVLSNVEGLLQRLRPTARIKWSIAGNHHITTKFIGEWPEDRLDQLKATLGALPGREPITVKIRNLGFFPNAHSPRVFWAGMEAPGLAELAKEMS